ncbi:fibroblast growth factor 4-like [Archocentrus centrarchus]|uniref:fibroblast growth factor 4-like n=1 Tax=Archocentrus centrarchus TaxID=63155 RepID=UPI0011EA44D5|nr:fibroblast growth factor 4-like [Archocentrus centrarchus]
MNIPTLLPAFLLVLALGERLVGAKKQESLTSGEDYGTLLRRLWKLHMRDALLTGKDPSSHLVRQRFTHQLLYCRAGIGFHLQILTNGSVGGVHKPTEYCQLKVFAMQRGVVGIRGVQSGLYLCMSREGLAYGAEQFSDDCMLREKLEENHYTTYSSFVHPDIYLALSHKGELRRGNSTGPHQSCTHFLPRKRR